MILLKLLLLHYSISEKLLTLGILFIKELAAKSEVTDVYKFMDRSDQPRLSTGRCSRTVRTLQVFLSKSSSLVFLFLRLSNGL